MHTLRITEEEEEESGEDEQHGARHRTEDEPGHEGQPETAEDEGPACRIDSHGQKRNRVQFSAKCGWKTKPGFSNPDLATPIQEAM